MACTTQNKFPIIIDCDGNDNAISPIDLGYLADNDKGTVTLTVGDDAVIPLATESIAGLMSPQQKIKLDALEPVDLEYIPSIINGVVSNSGGNNATIPLVGANAGLMSPTQKVNLDFLVNTAKKSAIFSSDGLTLSFSFPHGVGSTPSSVVLTNVSLDAMGYSHITYDSINITVNYQVAPPVGTNNLTFNAIVLK